MVDDMLELEVDKIIDETTRKVTESNIKGMIEILSSAGFDKNEITDMIAEKFKIDKAYVEKLFE